MMKKEYIYLPIILLAVGAIFSGCIKDNEPCPEGNGKVHLSFAIAMPGYGEKRQAATREAGTVTEGSYTEGVSNTGIVDEYKIHNLWVFLFKKDPADLRKSKCVFARNYTPGGSADSQLTEPADVKAEYYRTPVTLHEPGEYILVAMANTKQYVLLFPNGYKDIFAGRSPESFIGCIYSGGAGSFRSIVQLPVKTSTLAENVCPGQSNITDNGLLATYIEESFILPEHYYSKERPFIKPLDLNRHTAKVRVTITNLNGTAPYETSKKYKLRDVEFRNLMSTYYPLSPYPQFGKPALATGNKETSKLTDAGTKGAMIKNIYGAAVLNGLMGNSAFTAVGGVPQTEMFSFYSPSWFYEGDGTSNPNDGTEDYKTQLVFSFVALDGSKTYEYPITIYQKDKTNPSQNDYKLKPNTLYELDLTFKGKVLEVKRKVKINYQVQEWANKEIMIPAFE